MNIEYSKIRTNTIMDAYAIFKQDYDKCDFITDEGEITFYWYDDEKICRERKVSCINRIYLKVQYQNKGIVGNLVNEMMKDFPKLWVGPTDNPYLIKLLLKRGFQDRNNGEYTYGWET